MSSAKLWERNMYDGPSGGLYDGPGGGLYDGPGGGLYDGPGGGMYDGPDSSPYLAIHPPWPLLVIELRRIGMNSKAAIIERSLKDIG